MNALEAARDILGTDLVEASDYASSCPFCGGEMRRGADKERWHVGFDHHPDCSWLAMPQIVKALEAAETVVESGGHWARDDSGYKHVDGDDFDALATALA